MRLLLRLKQMIWRYVQRKLVILSVTGGMLLGILLASIMAAYFQREVRTVLQKEISELRITLDERNQRLEAQDAVALSMTGQISTLREFIETGFRGDSISGMVPRSPEEMCEQLLTRCAGPEPSSVDAAPVAPNPAQEPPTPKSKPKDDCTFDGNGSAEDKSTAMIRCVARLGAARGSTVDQPTSPTNHQRHRPR